MFPFSVIFTGHMFEDLLASPMPRLLFLRDLWHSKVENFPQIALSPRGVRPEHPVCTRVQRTFWGHSATDHNWRVVQVCSVAILSSMLPKKLLPWTSAKEASGLTSFAYSTSGKEPRNAS